MRDVPAVAREFLLTRMRYLTRKSLDATKETNQLNAVEVAKQEGRMEALAWVLDVECEGRISWISSGLARWWIRRCGRDDVRSWLRMPEGWNRFPWPPGITPFKTMWVDRKRGTTSAKFSDTKW